MRSMEKNVICIKHVPPPLNIGLCVYTFAIFIHIRHRLDISQEMFAVGILGYIIHHLDFRRNKTLLPCVLTPIGTIH